MDRLQKRWRRRLPALLNLMDVHSRAAASGSHQVQQMGGHEAAALAGRVARSLAHQRRIPMRKLAKGYDETDHPREHDGKFARKTGEIVGRVGVGVAGAVGGFLLGRKYGAQAGGFLARHSAKLLTKNPIDRLLHETAGMELGRTHGAKIAATAGAVAGGLAGAAGGAAVDRIGRNRRADAAYDRAASEGRMTHEEAAEAKGVYRRSKGRGIARQRKKEGLPMRKLSPVEQLRKGMFDALARASQRGAMRAARAAYREGYGKVMADSAAHARSIATLKVMAHADSVGGKRGYDMTGPTRPAYDNRHMTHAELRLDMKRNELAARNEKSRQHRYRTALHGANAKRIGQAAEANAGPEVRQHAKNNGRMYARDAMNDWRARRRKQAVGEMGLGVALGGAAYGAHHLTEKQRQQRVEAAKASAEARRGRGGFEKMADPYAGLPLAKAEQLRREDDAFAAQLRAALTMPVSAAFR